MQPLQTQWNPALYCAKHSFVYHYGEDLIDLLQPQANERILDIGCGAGQLTDKISKLAKEVIGMDNSSDMIQTATAQFKHIEFLLADAANFSFAKKFDAIFSNAALHWVTNYKAAIKCMCDCLKEQGRIVVELGGKGNIKTILDQIRYCLAKRDYVRQSQLQPWFFPSISEYTSALEAAGFEVKLAQHFSRPTELADKHTGIKDWLTMFAGSFFADIPIKIVEQIKDEIQENLKATCLKNDTWYTDYKRIRIVAVKTEPEN